MTNIASLTDDEVLALYYNWDTWARPEQKWPDEPWGTLVLRGGRGGGKTRTGAELCIEAERRGYKQVGIIGPTASHVRDVMIEGPSGIIACSPPWGEPKYEPSKLRLTWPNGMVGITLSAERPDRIRGANLDFAWCDEPPYWRYFSKAWSDLCDAVRIDSEGGPPRKVLTMTPRPFPLLREIEAQPGTVVRVLKTMDNIDNLSESFIRNRVEPLIGTELARQEHDGEYLENFEGQVYSMFVESRHVVDSVPRVFDLVYGALDWGVDHPTAFLVMGVCDGITYVIDEYVMRGTTTAEKIRDIKQLCSAYSVGVIYIDPSAAQARIDMIAAGGLPPVSTANNAVREGIERVQVLLERNELLILRKCVSLIAGMKLYEHRRDAAGRITPGVVVKLNDDEVDALRYGIMSAGIQTGSRVGAVGGGRQNAPSGKY